MEGIRKGFAGPDRDYPINLGSIKANIGHTECAAGVAGVIKAILMLNKGIIPPVANFKRLNPKIPALEPDNIAIPMSAQPWNVPYKAVIVNSYGAAGSNAALLMCQSPQKSSSIRATSPFPIILTAGSRKSLMMYASSLKKHLQSSAGSNKSIGDVSSTLRKTRKPQKFAWTVTTDDTQSLSKNLTDLSNVFELPENPKKVILAFSGQVKRFVGLDKALYDACPLLQKHLDICNHYLTSTGSPSIFPAIFQTEAFSDVVSLQCCMFALQYSFAKSWIDCGLEVSAVVGHSFGELTAMAVCGNLSLESTIDIIRARAKLIEMKWGPDPGSMLVIHGTEAVVNDVLSHLPVEFGKVEIACYNSKTSHVVVGSSAAISTVQQLLKDVSEFSTIRSSKADTSHGFHSHLTDELLADLDEVVKKHKFSPPRIPLEACTLDHATSSSHQRISQHFRQPVFFHHAVARIEKRFGACIWLEAGVDTPIIPMIQRAVESPAEHVFLPVKLTRGQEHMAAISEVTTKLWREGVHVSFFNFEAPGVNRVWLPPYAFERTVVWLPYVDPTTEALKNIPQPIAVPVPQTVMESAPQRLVNPTNSTKQFSIGTKTNRFKSIVAGHSVITNPLCPAALYLEAAIMAVKYSQGSLDNYGYTFWDFRIDSPLGIDYRRDVLLDIEGTSSSQDWSFVLKSSSVGQSKTTLHAKAGFRFFTSQTRQDANQFQYHQRFVKARLASFSTNANNETFKINRAYRLFSRVVNYSSILTGISCITMAGNEVMAELDLPAASDTEESSAIAACDTIAMDNFVQVVGLLVNSSDLCSEAEAFLATGADNITVVPGVNFKTMRKFRVYASFAATEGNKQTSGDVFVLDTEGKLVSVIIGMHFSKLPLSTLRKILEPANQKEGQVSKTIKTATPASRFVPAAPIPTSQSIRVATVPTSIKSISAPSQSVAVLAGLKRVVAEFSGADEMHVSIDALISDLGVDSLAAIELAEELQTQFNIDVSSTDITSTTISALALLVPTSISADFSHETIDENSSVTSVSSGLTTPSIGPSSQSSADDFSSIENLFRLIAEYAAIDASSINGESDLESLGVDSLSLIELKSALEDSYGIDIDFDVSVTVVALSSMLGINRKAPVRGPLPKASFVQPAATQVQFIKTLPQENLFAVVAEYAAIDSCSITTSASLEGLGVDSLSLIELKSALEDTYSVDLDFDVSTTVGELLSMLGENLDPAPEPTSTQQAQPLKFSALPSSTPYSNTIRLRDPIEALEECKNIFPASAQNYGLTGYCKIVKPKQDRLVLAYIVEAFKELGSDLQSLRCGEAVPTFHYLAKHSYLVPRLWDILTEAKIVEKCGSSHVRSSGALPTQASDVLLREMLAAYPQWAIDNKLLSITGSKLAKCLTGKADAVKLLFGDSACRDLLASFYSDSPQARRRYFAQNH
jgi:acyl transferase domain-containing protein